MQEDSIEIRAPELDENVAQPPHPDRIGMLDGWRALSILAVLASHWLPLGPHAWGLNAAVGAAGMAIFFTLSGLLIVQLLGI